MSAYIVEMENRPGMLAGLTEAIADKGINVTGVAAVTSGESGAVAILTDDEAGTRAVLEESGLRYREVATVETAMQHRPGSLAEGSRSLARAGVNVEAVLVTGMDDEQRVMVVFAVDDAEAAAGALG